ncbi:hypothetical protein [Thalassospira xiamenensis]|uniref:Uncharacterized protein n=1 Tax=Thalassospira xiamenensis TaxID=220697 RepID=A0A285TSI0_9PROT|nr:hypothetical protein [Thalassospira xiamenensis]SOC26846.1 hypothetical protein SAMN05428964_105219 [Thalassospira xiamenensis]
MTSLLETEKYFAENVDGMIFIHRYSDGKYVACYAAGVVRQLLLNIEEHGPDEAVEIFLKENDIKVWKKSIFKNGKVPRHNMDAEQGKEPHLMELRKIAADKVFANFAGTEVLEVSPWQYERERLSNEHRRFVWLAADGDRKDPMSPRVCGVFTVEFDGFTSDVVADTYIEINGSRYELGASGIDDRRQLREKRDAALIEEFEGYDFGDLSIKDTDGWSSESPGTHYSRVVYFDNPDDPDGDSMVLHFVVVFTDANSAEVEEAYALTSGGYMIGSRREVEREAIAPAGPR